MTASETAPAKATPLVWAVLLVMPLFYSSNFILGRAAVAETGPWTLAFFRWAIAAGILAVLARREIAVERARLAGSLPLLLVQGFLGMVVCGGLLYWALEQTTATNATLIYTVSPIGIVLLERVFGEERFSLRRWFGIALALAGVVLIIARAELDRVLAFRFNPGDAFVLVAALAWSAYSVLLRRPLFRQVPAGVGFAAIAACGAALLLPCMVAELWIGDRDLPSSGAAWASIAGIALVPSILAFAAYQYGVERVGAARTSVFLYLLPAYGIALAAIFLGERFEAYHAIGFACIMAGVVIVTSPGPHLARGGQRTV